MSESTQRHLVLKLLKPVHGIPVENTVGVNGCPDVNYTGGWIELKWLRAWPKRPLTKISISHFTTQQRRWLRNRCNAGGKAYLLLQVQKEWLLFTGIDAGDCIGNLTRAELYDSACARWTNGLKRESFIECLDRDWNRWDGCPVVND